MKKALAILGILTLSAVSFAQDTQLTGTLGADAATSRTLKIDSGKTSIEVFTAGDKENIGCQFADGYTGEVKVSEMHTHHCLATTNDLSLPATILITIFNNEKHQIEYSIKATHQ